jgi:hypothetical protein
MNCLYCKQPMPSLPKLKPGDEGESKFIGWTFDQWAHVRYAYGYTEDRPKPPPSIEGMLRLRQWWYGDCERDYEPLEVLILDAPQRRHDSEWAMAAVVSFIRHLP